MIVKPSFEALLQLSRHTCRRGGRCRWLTCWTRPWCSARWRRGPRRARSRSWGTDWGAGGDIVNIGLLIKTQDIFYNVPCMHICIALSGKYPPLELKLTSQGCCGKEVGWNCGCALVRSMDTRVRMWRQCTRGLPVSIIFTEQQLMRFFYSMVVLFNALCKQTYPTPLKDWSWLLTNGLQWLRRFSFMLEWQLLWNENSSLKELPGVFIFQ